MTREKTPINEQVIVITGSSSGIGLATAQEAVRRGARVVLAARSIKALERIATELNGTGGQALAVECDVGSCEQVQQVAEAAIKRFGRIDTWVNNAGTGCYGRLDEVSDEDNRRVFDTNFWGIVYGSLAALPHLEASGGTLINVGSEVSEAATPLLGIYTASKHAVKGFTDSLRLEVEQVDQSSVTITLIQPTAVNTPFPQHARNYMRHEPKLPDPMIEPHQVAEAILDAAVKPARDKKVGGTAVLNTLVTKMAPRVADRMSAKNADKMEYDEKPRNPQGALHQPSEATAIVGRTHGTGGVVAQAG